MPCTGANCPGAADRQDHGYEEVEEGRDVAERPGKSRLKHCSSMQEVVLDLDTFCCTVIVAHEHFLLLHPVLACIMLLPHHHGIWGHARGFPGTSGVLLMIYMPQAPLYVALRDIPVNMGT